MKNNLIAVTLLSLLGVLTVTTARSQGTAFTYQGKLSDTNGPVTGTRSLSFALYATNATGLPAAGPVTNGAVIFSNGLFTTTIDFGAGVFAGTNLWLGIAVDGSPELIPRQPVTPTPYAIFAGAAGTAGSVAAANIVGTIPPAQLPAGLVTNGASGLNLSGTFSGNGSGVTGVNLQTLDTGGAISYPTNNVVTTLLARTLNLGSNLGSFVVADVNGDGRPDLIIANTGTNTLTVLTNSGGGGFGFAETFNGGGQPNSVVAADVNGDGRSEFI